MARRARGARWSGLAIVAPVLALSAAAAATEPDAGADHVALARELFNQGRTALDQGDHARACLKFADSYRLAAGGGTLLNLALCNELSGKTATAWSQFQDALRLAVRDGRPDREQFAREHIAALESTLSRLRVQVPPTVRRPGLVVRWNGVTLGEGTWGEALPVDPGEQVIEVLAPGRETARLTVVVGAGGDVRDLVVPELAAETRPAPERRLSPPPAAAPGRTQRILGGILAGAGLVAAGVGGFFGVRALDRDARARDLCGAPDRCDPRGITLSRDASADAELATILLASGAATAGGGVVLFLTAPSLSASGESRGVSVTGVMTTRF